MDEKTAIVARLPIFARLEGRSLEAIATLAQLVSMPAGTVLMGEGEAAESFYVIVTGTVHVTRNGEFMRSMSDGGFLGEIALVEETTHTATVTCATACEFVQLDRYEFGRVMARFPDVGARIDTAVARRPHQRTG
ncbi:MAG TPA: cyclic nucleotide-binding domain-containing protein [Candidatus Limnocylindrales bacterium]|nr:cyclic nucleotide-binding domain-containing protein [Candidatus Limnocylindrales bacterium]